MPDLILQEKIIIDGSLIINNNQQSALVKKTNVTYDSFLAEEEVHHGDVLLPGVVACLH